MHLIANTPHLCTLTKDDTRMWEQL